MLLYYFHKGLVKILDTQEKKSIESSHNIPIFPLEGVVMFPDTYLPLNIFEPRYLKMINRAISSENRLIGMIQPIKNNSAGSEVNFHQVGCVGKIIKFEETVDNRYLITLKGYSRFHLISDKTNQDNYIMGEIDWSSFNQDLKKEKIKQSYSNLKSAFKNYLKLKNIKVNAQAIDLCYDYNLVDQLTMICPLAPEEKQLLLETISLSKRNNLLLSIINSYIKQASISDIIKHRKKDILN